MSEVSAENGPLRVDLLFERPAATDANLVFEANTIVPLVDLLFDQPAARDANLVFGASTIAPRGDVTVRATLPLPVIAIKFIPPAHAEILVELPCLTVRTLLLRPSVPLNIGTGQGASLPGVMFSSEVRYASHTQRPTVGQTSHHWQVAQQTEEGSTLFTRQ